nr:prepilin-type N-terminal cleavage/methylation domain-containing protein [Gammaproteobacteria bacterium]
METGFNNTKGFTLIELLITLVIIGIMSSMVFINFSTLNSVEARGKSFQRTFDYLSEESITTGNIVGWYADNDSESAYFINIDGLKMIDSSIEMPSSGFQELLNYEKIFKSFDGNTYEINNDSNK